MYLLKIKNETKEYKNLFEVFEIISNLQKNENFLLTNYEEFSLEILKNKILEKSTLKEFAEKSGIDEAHFNLVLSGKRKLTAKLKQKILDNL